MVKGYIAHITQGRIRIKFPSKRGNDEFFHELVASLKNEKFLSVKANSITASLLIEHELSNHEILEILNNSPLFTITSEAFETPESRITKSVNKHIRIANNFLRKLSSGALDLSSAVLIFLILSALYQIGRGNISAMPWYAALFYLHSLITKK